MADSVAQVATRIIPFLNAAERFKIAQVCSTFRKYVYSESCERDAMMEYLKHSIIRSVLPTIYSPPFVTLHFDKSDDDTQLKPAKDKLEWCRKVCMMEFLTRWHMMAARAAAYNTDYVQITVTEDSNFETKMGEFNWILSLTSGLWLGWEYQVWDRIADAWADWIIGIKAKWYTDVVLLMQKDPTSRTQLPGALELWAREIDYSIQGLPPRVEIMAGNRDTDLSRVHNLNDFFSWDFVTQPSPSPTLPSENDDIKIKESPLRGWLRQLAFETLRHQVLARGFRPHCDLKDEIDVPRNIRKFGRLVIMAKKHHKITLYGHNTCTLDFR